MDELFKEDFCWETLNEQEKEELRAIMRMHLTHPDFSVELVFTSEACDETVKDEFARVRWFMSTNPNTPAPVLHELARCGSPPLLERIAENRHTHPSTLSQLSQCPYPEVRAAVAENENTPIETLRKLVKDEHPDVRYRLAENHKVSIELLVILQGDDNPYVAHRAGKTLNRVQTSNLVKDNSAWKSSLGEKRRRAVVNG